MAKAKAHGRYFTPDPSPQAGHFYRSDHFPFAKRGVPAISVGSGEDLVKGGKEAGQKAEEDYTTNRYHQPADEWSADWDLSGQAMDIGLFYEVGADLANSTAWPEWRGGLGVQGAAGPDESGPEVAISVCCHPGKRAALVRDKRRLHGFGPVTWVPDSPTRLPG